MSEYSKKTDKWNPDDYSRNSSGQFKFAMELIGNLVLKGNESLLDIGCGDGRISALLSTKLPSGTVTGIDLSDEMVSYSRLNYPPEKYPNLSFHVMSADNITFENEFDIIFSNSTLHWVKNQAAVLKGAWRSLKKGGRILFRMNSSGSMDEFFSVVDEIIASKKWAPYFNGFEFPFLFPSRQQYEKWLGDAAFSEISVKTIERSFDFEGRERFVGFILAAFIPYVRSVPEGSENEFVNAIVSRYLQLHPPAANGTVSLKTMRLDVSAVKK